MSTLPTDLNPTDGREAIFQAVDPSGYVHYPKWRGNYARRLARTILSGAVNIVLTNLLALTTQIEIAAGSTFTTITLPATLLIVRYILQIFDLKPKIINGVDKLEIYWMELTFNNLSATPTSLVGGDANTTFSGGAGPMVIPPGITKYRLELIQGGVTPIINIVPEINVAGTVAATLCANIPTGDPLLVADNLLACRADGTLAEFTNTAVNNRIRDTLSLVTPLVAPFPTGGTIFISDPTNIVPGAVSEVTPASVEDIIATTVPRGTFINNNDYFVTYFDTSLGVTRTMDRDGVFTRRNNAVYNSPPAIQAAIDIRVGSGNAGAINFPFYNDPPTNLGAFNTLIGGGGTVPSLGYGAGDLANDGNIVIGRSNIWNSTTALTGSFANNVIIGNGIGGNLSVGSPNNTVVGSNAMGSIVPTIGSTGGNCFFGISAGLTSTNLQNVIGIGNAAFGSGVLAVGTGAIAIGFQAGNPSGLSGVAAGAVLIGDNAGNSGTGNVSADAIAIGHLAGAATTGGNLGTNSICLGRGAGSGQTVANNTIWTIPILAGGPSANTLSYVAGGQIVQTASSKVYKYDIEDASIPVEAIDAIKPKNFKWKNVYLDDEGIQYEEPEESKKIYTSFIAEELFEAHPALARKGNQYIDHKFGKEDVEKITRTDVPVDIDDRALIALLVKAVKDLRSRLAAVESAPVSRRK